MGTVSTVTTTQVARVAKTICAVTHWCSVTNLQLPKMLYIMQMLWMGENKGQLLFGADFEAWHYGPVVPLIYDKCKLFGARVIEFDPWGNRLPMLSGDSDDDDERRAYKRIKVWTKQIEGMDATEIAGLTRWKKGAWQKHYNPNNTRRLIPKQDIYEECKDRGWIVEPTVQRTAHG